MEVTVSGGGGGGLQGVGDCKGCEATDTQLPYDPRDTGHRSSPTTLFCCTAALFVHRHSIVRRSPHSALPMAPISCTDTAWASSLSCPHLIPLKCGTPPQQFESVSYESGISCSPNSPQISRTDFCFMTHSYAFLAPLDALASACSFPVTPTCDGTHSTSTLSPSSCHCPHKSSHRSTCASGPLEPTHLCLDHLLHFPVNPLYTSSESVTTRRGRPGHL